MLHQEQRQAIIELRKRGHSHREIARLLGVSRGAVARIAATRTAEVPRIVRAEKAEAHRDEILELIAKCKANLVRVHEELRAGGVDISYAALTSFCRRHGLSPCERKKPAGFYEFAPSQEMQHDTSPHDVSIGGQTRRVQTASLVLCYSRIIFFQFYPAFRRFECKLFLTEALRYVGGACRTCMIDNTHVVVLTGTGEEMIPVPEMDAFAKRFGFEFRAHRKGDANRSARVERPFDFIERNFLAGREFADWNDANQRARDWCDKVNASYKRHLGTRPRELFAIEQAQLLPLPAWVPDPYEICSRIVDVDGFITIQRNRYSVPARLIGRRLEAHLSKDRVVIYEGPREVASHPREIDPKGVRIVQADHRPPRGESHRHRHGSAEEEELKRVSPEIDSYVQLMKKQPLARTLALQRLMRMVRDYPTAPVIAAIHRATQYGMFDMDRLETMILHQIRRDYFRLHDHQPEQGDQQC